MQNVHFTPPQLAPLFGVNVSTIKRWINQGFLKSEVTPGGHRRINREQLLQFTKKYPKYAKKSYVLHRLKKQEYCPEPDCWKKYYGYLLKNNTDAAVQLIDKLYLSGTPILKILKIVITPTLRHMGKEWSKGNITVYEEHRISFHIRSHLLKLDQYIPDKSSLKSPAAILACAPGEYHELPLQLVALIFKQNGWRTFILGVNINITELIKATKKIKPNIIVVSKTYTNIESPSYYKKLLDYAEKNNICLASGGAAWKKKFSQRKWRSYTCTRYFPALKLFDEHLKNYKRK
ncbi:cobalamin-dependent protein [Patescibacteria group bacterium]|nr:cobalamin-dependent protein [Patescibacteria group bacterium]MBU0964588.1 cobalamin-dependent protein [Patescibacteria group bacterium]